MEHNWSTYGTKSIGYRCPIDSTCSNLQGYKSIGELLEVLDELSHDWLWSMPISRGVSLKSKTDFFVLVVIDVQVLATQVCVMIHVLTLQSF